MYFMILPSWQMLLRHCRSPDTNSLVVPEVEKCDRRPCTGVSTISCCIQLSSSVRSKVCLRIVFVCALRWKGRGKWSVSSYGYEGSKLVPISNIRHTGKGGANKQEKGE